MKIEIEREEDGRWLAEVDDLPGVLIGPRMLARIAKKTGLSPNDL